MSHSTPGQQSSELDFEINLAPIIDCLTVLITFTLISAAFLSISIFDAGVSASKSAGENLPPPPIEISVVIHQGGNLDIRVTGEQNRTTRVEAKDGTWNYEGLTTELKTLREKFPTVDGISLSADEDVEYETVAKTMDTVSETQHAVILGGF